MQPFSDNTRGIMFMCASMLAFTLNDTMMKAASQQIPMFQAIFARGVLTSVGLLTLAAIQQGRLRLLPARADRLPVVLRTIGELTSTAFFLTALAHMPLANLSAILQSLPLAVTLAAAAFFKEPIGWRRLTAIFVGFIGMLIVIRPGGEAFDRWSVLGLAAVAAVVLRDLATRRFSRAMPSVVPAVWASVSVMVMGALGAVAEGAFAPPPPLALAETSGAAVFLVVGYLMAIKTMRVGEIGTVAPFRYTSLFWAILLGWLLFGNLPDRWTVLGATIVIGSGLYMLWRERHLRNPVTAPVVEVADIGVGDQESLKPGERP